MLPPRQLRISTSVQSASLKTPPGETMLFFCNHPFTWSSSSTGYAVRPEGSEEFTVKSWEVVPRGSVWDVAGTRITASMPVPREGVFRDFPDVSVYFYDGLECLRRHDEGPGAFKRPRGHSCEELGGALYGFSREFPKMERLSRLHPLFVSPYGTGCSRYVDVLVDEEGITATWQQGQKDGSQPLVMHRLPMSEIKQILS